MSSPRRARASAALAACMVLAAAVAQAREPAPDVSAWSNWLGRFHPALIHFPIALLLVAVVAEALCVVRRDGRYADAARFMVTAAAWISIPAAATGFFRADSLTFTASEQHLFAIHRIAGIATPVLIFLCAGLSAGVRRSGQIWELWLYRGLLVIAAAAAVVAGHYGGEIVFGSGFFPLW